MADMLAGKLRMICWATRSASCAACREGDAILEAGDHVVSPKAGVLIGKFVRREAHGHPELRLVEVPGLQGKLETARHHADDRVGLAVENDGTAEDVRIAVVAVQPQGITDDCQRLMGVLFLLRKDAAKDGLNAEGGEDTCGEPGGVDFFRSGAAGKLKVGGGVAAKRGERAGCVRVGADLAGSHGSVRALGRCPGDLPTEPGGQDC